MHSPARLPKTTPGRLGITISRQGTRTTVELDGELDLVYRAAARQAVLDALQRHPKHLVLDLSRLTFTDCSGVHVVLEAAEQSAQQDTRLLIVPGPTAVQRVFELCQLTEALPFLSAA